MKELRLENLEREYKAHLNRSDPLSWAKSIVGFADGEGLIGKRSIFELLGV